MIGKASLHEAGALAFYGVGRGFPRRFGRALAVAACCGLLVPVFPPGSAARR